MTGRNDESEEQELAPITGARHIPPEGFQRLQDQVDQLWSVERPNNNHLPEGQVGNF